MKIGSFLFNTVFLTEGTAVPRKLYHRRQECRIILSQQLNAAENFQSHKPYKYYSHHNYSLQGTTALKLISMFKLMNVIRKGSVKPNSLCSEAAVAVPWGCSSSTNTHLPTASTAGFFSFPRTCYSDFLVDIPSVNTQPTGCCYQGAWISVCQSCCLTWSCCHPGASHQQCQLGSLQTRTGLSLEKFSE